jgi:hypothetical protein
VVYIFASIQVGMGKHQSVTMANYCDLATALHPKQCLLRTIPLVATIEDGKLLVDNTSQMQHHVVSLIMNHNNEVNEIQPISVVSNNIHNNGTLYKVKMSGNFHVDKRWKTIINEDDIGGGKAIADTRVLVTTTVPPNEII